MIRLQTSPGPDITVFSAGQRAFSRILSGKRNAWFTFVITATVTIAGGAVTQDVNGGNLAALFQFIGIDENGYDAAVIDARAAKFLSSVTAAGLPADITLPSLAANGAYNLRTTIRLPFAWMLGVDPMETAYVERDPTQDTNVFVQPWSTGVTSAASRLCISPGTSAITNLSVHCYQHFDDKAVSNMPIFVPRYRMMQQVVSGTASLEPFFVRSASALRGIILGQDTTGAGEVGDILTAIAFRDSLRDYIGPRQGRFQELAAMQTSLYGGRVSNAGGSAVASAAVPAFPYYLHNFQQFGKLSNIWNPATAGQDLRFEMDQIVSATAAAGTSNVNAVVMELNKIQNRTADAGFSY